MRYHSIISIIVVFLTASPVLAETAISGVVLSIKSKGDEMVILQDGTGRQVTIRYLKGHIPGSLSPGTQITAGGKFRSNQPDRFDARRLVPYKGGLFKLDPTGVRKRLFQGKPVE